MKKIEKTSVLFVFFKKNIFLGDWEVAKKTDMSGIKAADKKYTMLKIIKKKKKFFLRKMLVWIKDDRDNVTRWENLQKKDVDSD